MYNCLGITLFFNEFEMLFLQLKTLSRVCDHIIIVEPECNTRGELRKNLEFGRFLERFGDMIKGIPYEYLIIPRKEFKDVKDFNNHFAGGENQGKCRAIPILNNTAKYYIYKDVDEIFSDEQIEEIKSLISGKFTGMKEFKYFYHNYYLNWQCVYPRGWKRILCLLKSNPVIFGPSPTLFDYEAAQEFALKFKGMRPPPTQTNIKTTGYHFSYLYSIETKLKNVAHTELTSQVSNAMKRKEKRIAAVHPKWKCKSIPIESIQIQDLHENIKIFNPFIGP